MPDLRDAINAVLDTADGVVDNAVPLLVRRANNSNALYREMCDPYLPGIARDLLNAAVRERRVKVVAAANNPKTADRDPLPRERGRIVKPESERLRAYGSSVLMFFQLPGGVYLKDAGWSVIDPAIEHYSKQARTESARAKFLQLVRNALPNARVTVERALSEEKLNQFWTRTHDEEQDAA